jgi:hypothetical protein
MNEIVLLASSVPFGSFVWGMVRFFRQPAGKTAEAALVSLTGAGCLAWHAATLASCRPSWRALGFTVEIRADAPLAKLREAAQTFARSLKPGDVGLFYFSGHGMQIDGRNLLAPVDFTARAEATAREACLEFDDVQDRLERSPAALSILIMDACRNNPFLRTRSWARGLALVEARLGSYVAFAASPGQTASDNVEERNGLFTKYLLAKLKDPLPLSALFREVRRLA